MLMSKPLSELYINKGTWPADHEGFDRSDAQPKTLTILALKFDWFISLNIYCSEISFDIAYEYLSFVGGPIVIFSFSSKLTELP